MKTIIIPTDFSEQAHHALSFAAGVARKNGETKLLLLHIIEGLGEYALNTTGEVEIETTEETFTLNDLNKRAYASMNDLVSEKEFKGLNIEGMVRFGNPYKVISEEIARRDAELVVMGTKGAGGLEEVLIGSNAEKVVRYSKCPVITLKQKVSIDEIDNIVLATNLTENQSHLVEELKKLQALTGATLHLLKVNTPNYFHTNRQLEEQFRNYVDKYKLTDYTTNIYNDATEEDGILYFAEDLRACLIALGTHGRTGLLHLLSGSIAEDLVNHAKIPIWTISMRK